MSDDDADYDHQCNFCALNFIRQHALADRMSVTLVANTSAEGGTTAYVHPPRVVISALTFEKRQHYFVAWFMELPETCQC